MIISISGRPGSGKSTVAKVLARELGFFHASAGDFMREIAAERGVTILELSRRAERDVAIDHEIDARTARLGEQSDDFVIDARLAWYFLPDSIKVFLDVRPEVGASRIFGAGRAAEQENIDLASTIEAVARRTESEVDRYRRYYGVDYLDPRHFDLVVDTSDRDVGGVVDDILAFLADAHGVEALRDVQPDDPGGPL